MYNTSVLELVDTHCHIHSADYGLEPDSVIHAAMAAGVARMICVGTDVEDSRRAVAFVQDREGCYAAVGIHPHEASRYVNDEKAKQELARLAQQPKVVAMGECGLDYFYDHSRREDQIKLLEYQLGLAFENDLPLIFHVRNASRAFTSVLTMFDYDQARGVIHSFSGSVQEYEEIESEIKHLHGPIYFGLNGIMTFTKDQEQLAAAKSIPLQNLLLETDAPFLTPKPFRGTICEPKHVRVTAEFLAGLRGEDVAQLAAATTSNARKLFGI